MAGRAGPADGEDDRETVLLVDEPVELGAVARRDRRLEFRDLFLGARELLVDEALLGSPVLQLLLVQFRLGRKVRLARPEVGARRLDFLLRARGTGPRSTGSTSRRRRSRSAPPNTRGSTGRCGAASGISGAGPCSPRARPRPCAARARPGRAGPSAARRLRPSRGTRGRPRRGRRGRCRASSPGPGRTGSGSGAGRAGRGGRSSRRLRGRASGNEKGRSRWGTPLRCDRV